MAGYFSYRVGNYNDFGTRIISGRTCQVKILHKPKDFRAQWLQYCSPDAGSAGIWLACLAHDKMRATTAPGILEILGN